MRLAESTPDWVVKNAKSKVFYRFERLEERGRARIRPLELFPTGLLIPKPTPTTVSGDLEVIAIGLWSDEMVVEGMPSRAATQYQAELRTETERLVGLQDAYEQLPAGGVGQQSRGSWANKIKNCQGRIMVLERGLAFVPRPETEAIVVQAPQVLAGFKRRQLVQLPSGRPARVLALTPSRLVRVMTIHQGVQCQAVLPPTMLRDWGQARLCSA